VPQKQKGYSIVTVTTPQGNLTGDQMRGLADIADQAGDGFLRFSMIQNVIFGWVPDGAMKRVYGALAKLGPGGWRRRRNQRSHHLPGRV
jgi:sulfite reductase beta subunit-like hemoprotein